MADVILILISVFVCGFALAFVVLAIASIFYRAYTLRAMRRKLYPTCKKTCEVATINGNRRFSCADVEKATDEIPPEPLPTTTIQIMSTTSTDIPLENEEPQAENKSPKNSARSIAIDSTTIATEAEEQLLGVGHLPKDIQAEQDLKDALKKAFGPPEPKFD